VRLKKKEHEKEKGYNFAKEEEREKSSELNSFKNDVRALRELEKRIEEYEMSSKPQEHEKIVSKVAAIVSDVEAKKNELEALVPKLNDIKRAVDDQDRYKKNLSANIQILEAEENVKVLEKELAEHEEKRDAIEGSATADEEFNNLKSKLEGLQQDLARLGGVRSSHIDQIRALKVGLFLLAWLFSCRSLFTNSLFALYVYSANFRARTTRMWMSSIVFV